MEIPIPGFTSSSGINTKELIEKLVEAEREPIKRIERNIKNAAEEAKVWADLNKSMGDFQQYAKKLYGFENPFAERAVSVSDESVLTAKGSRTAAIQEYEIGVKQAAKADSWMSDTIKSGLVVPEGQYTFLSGSDEFSFSFAGGAVSKFVSDFTKKTDEKIMRMRLIQKNINTNDSTLVLEGMRPGKKYALHLKDKSTDLAKLLGWQDIADAQKIWHTFVLTARSATKIMSGKNLIQTKSNVVAGLDPGAIIQFKFDDILPMDITLADDAVLAIVLRAVLAASVGTAQDSSNGRTRTALLEDGALQNGSSAISARVEDAAVDGIKRPLISGADEENSAGNTQQKGIIFSSDNKTVLYSAAQDTLASGELITVTIPFDAVEDGGIVSFTAANPFPGYALMFDSVKAVSSAGRKADAPPKYKISKAQDAVIAINGVDIERERNTIDDVLPGVVLDIKRASDKNVLVSVESAASLAKEDIINFVGSYNRMMKMLTIYTSSAVNGQNTVLESLQFDSQEEREYAEKNAGRLAGNFSLVRLTNSLVTGMTRQYNSNPSGREYNTLRSIGIGSSIAGGGGTVMSRFLDIDEAALDEALLKNFGAAANLFGFDSNGDISIDDGAAFYTGSLVEPFISVTGIVAQKQAGIKSAIQRDQQIKNRYEQRLEAYRQKITRDYAHMESSLSQLEAASETLQQFSGSGKADK